jgi:hypothetical protein
MDGRMYLKIVEETEVLKEGRKGWKMEWEEREIKCERNERLKMKEENEKAVWKMRNRTYKKERGK